MRLGESLIRMLRAKPFSNVSVSSVLAGLVLACLVAVGVLYGLTVPHRSRARDFLKEFAELKLGESTFAEAQRLAREYRGLPWYVAADDMRCTFQRCLFAFQFDNTPLSYVPCVGYTQFFALISVKDGLVDGREINYERISRCGDHYNYVLLDSVAEPPKGWEYGVMRLKVDPNDPRGVPHVLEVRLGAQSTAELRKRAYSLDLSCLAKLCGCGGPSSFYPSGLNYLGPPFQSLEPGPD